MKENNQVLIESKTFALRIIKLYQFLKNEKHVYVLSKQVLRSGTSIGANIRESVNAQSRMDFINKLNIALKEANETEYWLELIHESGIIDDKQFDSIYRKEVEAAGNELVLLEKYTEKAQLLEAVADADALIIRSDKVDAEVLDAAKQLKIVVRAGAGYDNIDLAAATAHNVVAENTPGQNANAVAELVFGLLVMAVRGFYNGKSGSELLGKKLGILAFGNVGRNVARIAKGFGMDVYAFDAYCPAEVIEAAGVHAVANQEELFKTCDVVSLHIPATAETKQSINYALVGLMKKGGILVNTARKEVINEPELVKLRTEREDLKFVTDIKPDADAEFAQFEGRYFSTPKKMGAQTAEANINAGIAAARQINAFFKDGDTKFQVNK